MAQRRVRDSAVCQHYHYDADHRITAVTFEHDPQGNQRAEYEYDILGRRTGKRVWQSVQAQRLKQPPENRAPEETVQFCWNGLRLAAEKSSKSAHLTLHYVYNSGSYNPLARIESFNHPEKQTTDISYYHVALNGLPEELTDSQGRIIWHGDYSLWGKLKREQHPIAGFRGQQNLRFQGQYFDRETGLHYNTFRYYAPDTGRFTQQDPIGLAGGLNLYQYAPNPVGWVDPWGLHDILADTDIVCRGGACLADSFKNGSGAVSDINGKLSGISTQAKPNAGLDILSQPFRHNQIGVATVADIEKAGGKITLDGKLNSSNGSMMMNHATVDGITAEQAEKLFHPTQQNPIPVEKRGPKIGC